METLATELRAVRLLNKKLLARKSIQGAKGHWEHQPADDVVTRSDIIPFSQRPRYDGGAIWAVPTEPDREARTKARDVLETYRTSNWVSVRYAAEQALGNVVDDEAIGEWFDELESGLEVTRRGGEQIGFVDAIHDDVIEVDVSGYYDADVPDKVTRARTREDLETIYAHRPVKKHRAYAGYLLGYLKPRIWAHELLLDKPQGFLKM